MPRNLYSASQLGRRLLCPGSAKAEDGLSEIESEDSRSGIRVHRAALFGDEIGCTDEEIAMARRCREKLETPSSAVVVSRVECELWLPREMWADYGFTEETAPNGTIDRYLTFADGTAQIDDIKSGWGEPDQVALTGQLSIYAALVLSNHPEVQSVVATAHFLRSAKSRNLSVQRRQLNEMLNNYAEIVQRCQLRRIFLSPSPAACRYCRAAPTCPGPRSIAHGLSVRDLANLPAPQLNALFEMAGLAERQVKAVKDAMRAAIEAGAPGLDYEIEEKPGNREVEDLPGLWHALRGVLDEDETLDLIRISIPEAEKAYKRAAEEDDEAWSQIEKRLIVRGAPKRQIVKKAQSTTEEA